MTVRSSINASNLRRELTALEEASPSSVIGDVLDAMFSAGRAALGAHDLGMPQNDGWAEAEAVIFDAVRRASPGKFDLPIARDAAA